MVDFEKLMKEEPVIAEAVEGFVRNIEEFQEWLRKTGCSRVYEYIEKRYDNVVIFKSPPQDREMAPPEISIWLPKWW